MKQEVYGKRRGYGSNGEKKEEEERERCGGVTTGRRGCKSESG